MRPRCQAGYTLVELLISISIISVLLFGVANAFFTSNRAQLYMEEQLGSKNDLLNVTSYFTQDAQSATGASAQNCAGDAIDPDHEVAFTWTDAATSDVYRAVYELPSGETRLVRTLCRQAAGAGSFAQEQRNNLGRQIDSVEVQDLVEGAVTVGQKLKVTTTQGKTAEYRAYFRKPPV